MNAKPLTLVVAVLIMIAGCAFFYFAVPGSPAGITEGRALHPWPDGAEYLDAAVSLVRDGSYTIHVAGEQHPPRYPFGHSAAIAVALWLGAEPAEAAYRTNQWAGGLLLGLLALMLWRRGRRLEGALAVALLATLPAFVILCRSPLSEITSTLLTVVAVWQLYRYSEGAPTWRGITGAALLGLGLCFRASSIFLFLFVPAAIFARFGWKTKSLARDLVLLGACFGLGLLPAFLYNVATFGHPLRTGYEYWVPFWNAGQAFDGKFVGPNLTYYWQELSQKESEYTAATTYGPGQGSYLTASFVLLACLALFVFRRRRRVWCFALAGIIYQGMMTFYFFRDARLVFPLLVLAVPLIARGLVEIWHRRKILELTLAAPLLIVTLLGWPNGEGNADSIAFLVEPKHQKPFIEGESLRLLNSLQADGPRLILTDMVPPYVHALSPADTTVAPLNHEHLYRHHPDVFRYGSPQRDSLVARALAAERTVWALTRKLDIFSISTVYTAPTGFAWEIVARQDDGSGIARLVALGEESGGR